MGQKEVTVLIILIDVDREFGSLHTTFVDTERDSLFCCDTSAVAVSLPNCSVDFIPNKSSATAYQRRACCH